MLIVFELTRPRPAHDPPMGLSKCAVMRVFSSVRGKLFGMWQSRRLQAQDFRLESFEVRVNVNNGTHTGTHTPTHTPWTLVLTLKPAAHKKWQQTVLVVRLGRPVCCFTCSTPLTICFSSTTHRVAHTQSTRTLVPRATLSLRCSTCRINCVWKHSALRLPLLHVNSFGKLKKI